MATSGTTSFNLTIDDVISEAYERIGIQSNSGHDLKSARRSLNILFSLSCNARAYIFQNSPRAKKYVTSKFCLFESFYKAIENISLQSFD